MPAPTEPRATVETASLVSAGHASGKTLLEPGLGVQHHDDDCSDTRAVESAGPDCDFESSTRFRLCLADSKCGLCSLAKWCLYLGRPCPRHP